jgi:hypothetical protein
MTLLHNLTLREHSERLDSGARGAPEAPGQVRSASRRATTGGWGEGKKG